MKILIFLIILAMIGFFFYHNYWQQSLHLKPQDEAIPKAEACSSQLGDVVTVTIAESAPLPACAKIKSNQELRVVNNTEQRVKVWFENVSPLLLAPSTVVIGPADDYTFKKQAGEYLAPGVHFLKTSPYSGPEIWLVQ